MKLFVLIVLLVAGVSSSLFGFRRNEPENYGYDVHSKNSEDVSEKHGVFMKRLGFFNYHPFWDQIKNFDEDELEAFVKELKSLSVNFNEDLNINSLSSRKKDIVLVPGLGVVNTHSPLWEALEGMTKEEKATFIKQLKSIKQKKKSLVKDKVRVRRDASQVTGENSADSNAEFAEMDLAPQKYAILLSGLGFINPQSSLWSTLRKLTQEVRDTYIQELIQSQQPNTEIKTEDQLSPETIVYIPGLGLVRKDSDLWLVVKYTNNEELASFFEDVSNKYGEDSLYSMGLVKPQGGTALSFPKLRTVFRSGFGFVSTQRPTWLIQNRMTGEETPYIGRLQEMRTQKEKLPNSRSKRAIREVEEEIDIQGNSNDLNPKKVGVVPGTRFVDENSPLWNILKNMNSYQVADFFKETITERGREYFEGLGLSNQKYTAVRAI